MFYDIPLPFQMFMRVPRYAAYDMFRPPDANDCNWAFFGPMVLHFGLKSKPFRGEGHDDAGRCANEAGGGWEDFGLGFRQLQSLVGDFKDVFFFFVFPFLLGHTYIISQMLIFK